MPRSMTARIGPIEQKADQAERVVMSALIASDGGHAHAKGQDKGTVIGPVATPPESKATAKNSAGVNIASAPTRR